MTDYELPGLTSGVQVAGLTRFLDGDRYDPILPEANRTNDCGVLITFKEAAHTKGVFRLILRTVRNLVVVWTKAVLLVNGRRQARRSLSKKNKTSQRSTGAK